MACHLRGSPPPPCHQSSNSHVSARTKPPAHNARCTTHDARRTTLNYAFGQDDPNFETNWPSAFGPCSTYTRTNAHTYTRTHASITDYTQHNIRICHSSYNQDLCDNDPFCNHDFCAEDFARWFCPKQCNTCEAIGWASKWGDCSTYAAAYAGCNAGTAEACSNHGYCTEDIVRTYTHITYTYTHAHGITVLASHLSHKVNIWKISVNFRRCAENLSPTT